MKVNRKKRRVELGVGEMAEWYIGNYRGLRATMKPDASIVLHGTFIGDRINVRDGENDTKIITIDKH